MKRSQISRVTLDKIKISIPSKNQILSLSSGEVKVPLTLDYRSLIPCESGLFCNKIFGSEKNNFCSCGSISKSREESLICDICETEVSPFRIRRVKMGHILLNDYFLNTLFFKSTPSYLSLILNISVLNIENVLYNNYYVVINPGDTELSLNQILNFEDYFFFYKKYCDKFYAETGILAIKQILDFFDLEKELALLRSYFFNNRNCINSYYKKQLKRYRLLFYLKKYNVIFKNIVLKVLPVLPCDLRPIVKLSNLSIASSDLNELYRRLIIRNIRLKKILNMDVSDIILINEKKIIQDSIDNLFDNSEKLPNVAKGLNNRILKSISANIKGKLGLFRHNLLGKRVDYSGRSVIVSGPNLKIDECGLPKDIALELFRPFIYSKLISLNDKFNIKNVKFEVNKKTNLVFDILSDILKDRFILLNRAPTLHRLGMQSFRALLTNDKAIKVHPLVCSAFNADFDGDQMAVHIPISTKTKNEFKTLLLSSNNILHPANGEFTVSPTQDIVLGIYYSTKLFYNESIETMIFNNLNDAKLAYNSNLINLNTKIYLRLFDTDNSVKFYETTIGRYLIYDILPKGIPYNYINKLLKKSDIINLLSVIYEKFGSKIVLGFCNNLMKLGFSFATQSGISISVDDLIILDNKRDMLDKTKKLIFSYNSDYLNGFLSLINRKKKILDTWQFIIEMISNLTIENFYNKLDNLINSDSDLNDSLYMITDSGARGSDIQMRQMCSMRGMIFYKNQGLMEIPVASNLREGLDILEYFYFSHSSRKTLADTALKTSSAGYLTRRLVESANNVFIAKFNCKTSDGIIFKNLVNKGEIIESLLERIIGRVTCENIVDSNKNILFKKNTLLSKNDIESIKFLNINLIKIRSPLTCKCKKGICSLCYGLDLSKGKLVSPGELVGIVAAQAIGEPGTQLTMRTFHTGGALNKDLVPSSFVSNSNGFLKYSSSLKYIINNKNEKIVVSNIGKIKINNSDGNEIESFNVPYCSILLINDNTFVNKSDVICKWDPFNKLIISDRLGYVKFENFINNLNYVKRFDFISGKYNFEISNYYKNTVSSFFPFIKVCNNLDLCEDPDQYIKFNLEPGSFVLVNDGDYVGIGDLLVKNSVNIDSYSDITGGLPKIVDLFEARVPKNHAVLSPFDGIVYFKKSRKGRRCFIVSSIENKESKFCVSSDRVFLVNNGQIVNKGDIIVNGKLNPHDILSVYGIDELTYYLLSEIKGVYYSQGVKISDKHIEIIIKQMLTRVVITFSSIYSPYIIGEIFDKDIIDRANRRLNKNGKKLIIYNIILTGITKSSLSNKSFLSSASFQQTTSVLSKSAIRSKTDNLKTFKTYIMLGKLMPVGTGYYSKIFKKLLFLDNDAYDKPINKKCQKKSCL